MYKHDYLVSSISDMHIMSWSLKHGRGGLVFICMDSAKLSCHVIQTSQADPESLEDTQAYLPLILWYE